MLLPIRYPKRPKKAEYGDLFSGGGLGKTGELGPVLFPGSFDPMIMHILYDMQVK
jgi:hypothetical protein